MKNIFVLFLTISINYSISIKKDYNPNHDKQMFNSETNEAENNFKFTSHPSYRNENLHLTKNPSNNKTVKKQSSDNMTRESDKDLIEEINIQRSEHFQSTLSGKEVVTENDLKQKFHSYSEHEENQISGAGKEVIEVGEILRYRRSPHLKSSLSEKEVVTKNDSKQFNIYTEQDGNEENETGENLMSHTRQHFESTSSVKDGVAENDLKQSNIHREQGKNQVSNGGKKGNENEENLNSQNSSHLESSLSVKERVTETDSRQINIHTEQGKNEISVYGKAENEIDENVIQQQLNFEQKQNKTTDSENVDKIIGKILRYLYNFRKNQNLNSKMPETRKDIVTEQSVVQNGNIHSEHEENKKSAAEKEGHEKYENGKHKNNDLDLQHSLIQNAEHYSKNPHMNKNNEETKENLEESKI